MELVSIKREKAVCDSLQVAEKFGKNHKDVLRLINKLTAQNCAILKMFFKGEYKGKNGAKYPMMYMTRDGFSLLVMGFTGNKALEWKLKYIEAFNKMEAMLQERSTATWHETRRIGKLTRRSETDTIKQLVEYAEAQGSQHADKLYMTYSRLANKYAGITSRDEATIMQLNRLAMIEGIIANVIAAGIAAGRHYKEIYLNCKARLEMFADVAYLDVA